MYPLGWEVLFKLWIATINVIVLKKHETLQLRKVIGCYFSSHFSLEYLPTKKSLLKKMALNLQPHVIVVCEDVIANIESSVLGDIQSNLYF